MRWDASKCYHAAECVRGLPKVFDPKRKPWIELEHAAADEIKEVVGRCPSGALSIVGQKLENESESVQITPMPTGPYRIKGAFSIVDGEGNVIHSGNATALCACGQSKTKPFCDGTHKSLPGYEKPTVRL